MRLLYFHTAQAARNAAQQFPLERAQAMYATLPDGPEKRCLALKVSDMLTVTHTSR
jgi:hypothetical protein